MITFNSTAGCICEFTVKRVWGLNLSEKSLDSICRQVKGTKKDFCFFSFSEKVWVVILQILNPARDKTNYIIDWSTNFQVSIFWQVLYYLCKFHFKDTPFIIHFDNFLIEIFAKVRLRKFTLCVWFMIGFWGL